VSKKEGDNNIVYIFDTVTRDISCNSHILTKEEYKTRFNQILFALSLKKYNILVTYYLSSLF